MTADYPEVARKEVSQFLPRAYRKVLEVGCATGGFKRTLKASAEVVGIEPNISAAARAKENGYEVLVGTFDEVRSHLEGKRFDVVICNDVIEHMIDHDKFLQDIKSYIEPHGDLVGSVPNVRYFQNLYRLFVFKDWKYEDCGILDRTHLRFFTQKSLSRTFAENGYEVEQLGGINNIMHLPANSIGRFLRNVLLVVISGISFGYFRDIRYKQFGFRIRPK